MELVVQILMLFIVINLFLKLSFWKWWQVLIFSLLAAVFVLVMKQFAIMQSKTQLNDYFLNNEALQNAAVLVTVESAIGFTFCFAALRNKFENGKKRWIQFLYWYPGLLVFAVIFYLLTQSIFNMSGADFDKVTRFVAGGVLVVVPAAAFIIRKILPEKEFRLEVHFLVSLFIAITGLLITVSGNVTYAVVREPLNIKALVMASALFAAAFLTGYFWNRLKWRFLQKRDFVKNKDIK